MLREIISVFKKDMLKHLSTEARIHFKNILGSRYKITHLEKCVPKWSIYNKCRHSFSFKARHFKINTHSPDMCSYEWVTFHKNRFTETRDRAINDHSLYDDNCLLHVTISEDVIFMSCVGDFI